MRKGSIGIKRVRIQYRLEDTEKERERKVKGRERSHETNTKGGRESERQKGMQRKKEAN